MEGSEDSVVERLKSLSARIEATKRALEAQDKRLGALRSCADELGGALRAAESRVHMAQVKAQPLPTPGPRPAANGSTPSQPPMAKTLSAGVVSTNRAKFVLPAVEEEERLRTRPDVSFYPDTTPSAVWGWLRMTPYAALAAAGLAIGLKTPWSAVSLKDRAVAIVSPAPELAHSNSDIAPAAPLVPVDEQTVDEVLQLVYTYRPAGSRENVIEMLGPEIDSSPSAAPWLVERGDRPDTYHATLRPYGEALDEAPVYEFDVNLAAKSVRALPSTETALRGASVAASGR